MKLQITLAFAALCGANAGPVTEGSGSEAKEVTACTGWFCDYELTELVTEESKGDACKYAADVMSHVASVMHGGKLPTSMNLRNGKCTESTRKLPNRFTPFNQDDNLVDTFDTLCEELEKEFDDGDKEGGEKS